MPKYSSDQEKWRLQKRAQRERLKNQQQGQQQNRNQDNQGSGEFIVDDPFRI